MRPLSQLRDAERHALSDAGLIPPPPPHPGDPGNQDYRPVVVKVKLAGGNPGSLTTPCTYTYDVWRPETPNAVISAPTAQQITSLRLATAQTPEKPRAAAGRYTPAPDGSRGEAVYDYSFGAWLLLVAWKEIEAASECNP